MVGAPASADYGLWSERRRAFGLATGGQSECAAASAARAALVACAAKGRGASEMDDADHSTR